MATIIRSMSERQISDRRGNPTIEVELTCSDDTLSRVVLPNKALDEWEVRDIEALIENVNKIIAPALIHMDLTHQTDIDNNLMLLKHLDHGNGISVNIENNAIFAAVSIAVCKAGASVLKIPLYKHIANFAGNQRIVLPVPSFTVINTPHNNKEFTILPLGASSFKLAMQQGIRTYEQVRQELAMKYGNRALQGGFVLNNNININIDENECFELLKTAIHKTKFTGSVYAGMEVAASEFHNQDDNDNFEALVKSGGLW